MVEKRLYGALRATDSRLETISHPKIEKPRRKDTILTCEVLPWNSKRALHTT